LTSTSPSAHYLGTRTADKKLMLILTDGRPSDVDTHDERLPERLPPLFMALSK